MNFFEYLESGTIEIYEYLNDILHILDEEGDCEYILQERLEKSYQKAMMKNLQDISSNFHNSLTTKNVEDKKELGNLICFDDIQKILYKK